MAVLESCDSVRVVCFKTDQKLSCLSCHLASFFLLDYAESNNIFLNCQIIRTKNDHKRSSLLALQSKEPSPDQTDQKVALPALSAESQSVTRLKAAENLH